MPWKNVIIKHFLNIWMKRFSCLECSKIRGGTHLYSTLKCRHIECPRWEVLPTYRVPRSEVPTCGAPRCWVLPTYRVPRSEVPTCGAPRCGVSMCGWLGFKWLLIEFALNSNDFTFFFVYQLKPNKVNEYSRKDDQIQKLRNLMK